MNKYAANLSMLFNEVEFLEKFTLAKENGFEGVEYLFPYDFDKHDIKAELEKNNLKQILFDFPAGDFAAGDRGISIFPDRKSEFKEGVHKALEYANHLSCERLTVLVGIDNGKFTKSQLHDTLIENLNYASDVLKNTNIMILVEALNTIDAPNYFISNTKHCRKIIDEINLDSVKIQYDIYHMQIMEGDIIRTFDNNKDKIGHIQIADNPGRNEPGSGEINYENVFKHLSENYLGWIGCEYSPLGDTIKGLSWIDNIGGKSA